MATPGAPSPDPLSDAPPRPPGPQGSRGDRGGARLEEDGENRPAIGPRRAAVKSAWRLAGGARDVTERRGDARGAYKGRAPPRSRRESRAERLDGGFAVVAAASASHRLFRCPSGDQRPFFLPRASGPYSPLHEIVRGHFRSALWACESAHPHAAPGAPAPADGAGPTPRLGVPLPQREIGRREPERRGPSGLPGRTLAAHTPAERPRNAPGLQISAEQRVTSNPTRTLVDLGAAPYNRLYQLLEGENKKKELFITHGNLEEVAEKLKQDVSLVQEQLAVSAQEHSFFLSKLNSDVNLLCEALYQGGNQLLLSDQGHTCPWQTAQRQKEGRTRPELSAPRTESPNGCLLLPSGAQERRPGCNQEAFIGGWFGVCSPDPSTGTVSCSLQGAGLERQHVAC
ncbi:uncharacterized protein LOC113894600 isoform X2 [Bos indicus x Bos taurus]|uniref:uncharacterized protein LOC113894600 isoform X2 n=1 Tax=Bos indicus x Bos taurus TaxID=30522 RepID=UPI000F7D3D4A|nr:uncharacterized protein LOC113894600 isoform X2 [Bos indicus x Bos taurus]